MNTKSVANQGPVTSGEVSFEQMQRLAKSVAASKLFGVKNEDEALALMMVSQAEGRHPALAIRDYHIIQGRPSLKADTMLARFQAAGGKVDWKEYTDTKCVGVFSHPQAGSVAIEWTFERATKIGLTGKDNWKNYPRAMLRARCISEGVRTCFPGIAVGIYTPEEIESGEEIDITPHRTAGAVEADVNAAIAAGAKALTLPEIEAHVDAMNDAMSTEVLGAAYTAARAHAKAAGDKAARDRFNSVYELRADDIKAQAASAK